MFDHSFWPCGFLKAEKQSPNVFPQLCPLVFASPGASAKNVVIVRRTPWMPWVQPWEFHVDLVVLQMLPNSQLLCPCLVGLTFRTPVGDGCRNGAFLWNSRRLDIEILMQRNRFDAYFWCRVEKYGEVLTMLMDDPCGKEGEWQPRTLQTQFHLVHQQKTRRKTATRWVSMSKNLPMFCNCPWILPRWAQSGGIEEIGGTTGGMMGAGGPVTRWISDQWGDGLRKDLLIDLQDVWWKYWKWVLFRIHMNQGEACTSHRIIY